RRPRRKPAFRPPAPASGPPAGDVTAARRLRDHVAGATTPIAGLVIVALLQNVDITAGKHRFSTDMASSYGATAVAAKVLVWVAMGAGFYLVPETSRRHADGEDTRRVLLNAIAIVLVCAVPVLAIFAFGGRQLLKAAFGADRLLAVDALLPLGVAFTLLALTYLAIQYLPPPPPARGGPCPPRRPSPCARCAARRFGRGSARPRWRSRCCC